MNKIYTEDCFETMNKLDVKVNSILTSPPYNTTTRKVYYNHKKINGVRVYSKDKRYDEYLDTKTNSDYIDWTVNLFQSYDNILEKDGVVIYNLSYGSENNELLWLVIAEIINKTPFTVADCISWKKPNAMTSPASKNKLTRVCEFIFILVRKEEYNSFNTNKQIIKTSKTGQNYYSIFYNFIEASNNDEVTPMNRATYSTDLVRKLLLMYTKENDLVYDSFMGTGTTANACAIENRRYLGSEISEVQCKYAEERIKKTLAKQQLKII